MTKPRLIARSEGEDQGTERDQSDFMVDLPTEEEQMEKRRHGEDSSDPSFVEAWVLDAGVLF